MANRLRPLYCPWPRRFVYHTIPFGAAFIMLALLVALFLTPLPGQRGLHLAPLCVARDLGWCEHDYSRWGGHTSEALQLTPCSAHRMLSQGRSFPSNLAPALLRFAPVLRRYNSRTSSGEEGKGLEFCRDAPALYRALPRPDAAEVGLCTLGHDCQTCA
jgi:hypothetical protein